MHYRDGNNTMAKILEFPEELTLPKVTRQVQEELDEAQGIAFEAWEAGRRAGRLALAKLALEKSPYCIDALNIIACETPDLAERARIFGRAEKIGRKFLGEDFFRENKGIFWDILETRPYMRAKNGLAMCLRKLGDKKGAIDQLQELLELCEDDNLGVRYELLPMLAAEGRLAQAEKIAHVYQEDDTAHMLYGMALLAFAQSGPDGKADGQLAKAVAANKEAIKYLAGKKKMPKNLPDAYSLGSKEEAVVIAWSQLDSWQAVPGACDWLAGKIPARRGAGGKGKRIILQKRTLPRE